MRDVLTCKLYGYAIMLGDFFAETFARWNEAQILQFRRVQAMRNRLYFRANFREMKSKFV